MIRRPGRGWAEELPPKLLPIPPEEPDCHVNRRYVGTKTRGPGVRTSGRAAKMDAARRSTSAATPTAHSPGAKSYRGRAQRALANDLVGRDLAEQEGVKRAADPTLYELGVLWLTHVE